MLHRAGWDLHFTGGMEWHPIQTELENHSRGCSQVPQGGEGSGYTREFCSHRLQKLPLNLSSLKSSVSGEKGELREFYFS